MAQLKLNIYRGSRGGRRPGCGRKRIHSPGVAHRPREKVTRHQTLHVNFNVRASIRNKTCLKFLKRAILNARQKGLRVLHFSLEGNHIHLIVEAQSNEILTRGMRSLTITFAKGVNKGRIQMERYHLHVLRSIRETKNAIHYVLFNHQKHRNLKTAHINPYSSLGLIEDLKSLAKEARVTIIWRRLQKALTLDAPQSWAARKVLNQQNLPET